MTFSGETRLPPITYQRHPSIRHQLEPHRTIYTDRVDTRAAIEDRRRAASTGFKGKRCLIMNAGKGSLAVERPRQGEPPFEERIDAPGDGGDPGGAETALGLLAARARLLDSAADSSARHEGTRLCQGFIEPQRHRGTEAQRKNH